MNTSHVFPDPVPVLMVEAEKFLLEVSDSTFYTYSGGGVLFVLLVTHLSVASGGQEMWIGLLLGDPGLPKLQSCCSICTEI